MSDLFSDAPLVFGERAYYVIDGIGCRQECDLLDTDEDNVLIVARAGSILTNTLLYGAYFAYTNYDIPNTMIAAMRQIRSASLAVDQVGDWLNSRDYLDPKMPDHRQVAKGFKNIRTHIPLRPHEQAIITYGAQYLLDSFDHA